MAQAYERFEAKYEFLKSLGYNVEVKWSCEWNFEKVENEEIVEFLSRLNLSKPLSPKDAFKGGRTNAFRLYYQIKGGEKIKHIDVTSLYPTVNKKDTYMLGHPEIILKDFKDPREYFGFVKCTVKAPPNDRFPVLPGTYGGKLVFTLCTKCAIDKNQTFCDHEGAERHLEGTWATPELHDALENGYQVVSISEVWHWEQKQTGFFAKYIDTFLKIKMEASGWPSWCVTEEQKDEYIQEVFRKEGIRLDKTKISVNPGLKAIAKLMLNSFWGKFGMRDNLTKTEFIHKPVKFYKLMRSKQRKVHDIHTVTEECVMVTSSAEEDFNEGNNTSNIAIAAFTTSYARLRLLDMMRKLDERVLYTDTDSVIYVSKPGDWEPELGTVLGEWDNQLEADEDHIVSFVSLGPKTYAYETNTGRTEMKIKSITQNGHTEKILGLEEDGALVPTGEKLTKMTLENLLRNRDDTFKVVYPRQLKRDAKTQTISEVVLGKTLRLVYDKRVLLDDFSTVPYGTKRSAEPCETSVKRRKM